MVYAIVVSCFLIVFGIYVWKTVKADRNEISFEDELRKRIARRWPKLRDGMRFGRHVVFFGNPPGIENIAMAALNKPNFHAEFDVLYQKRKSIIISLVVKDLTENPDRYPDNFLYIEYNGDWHDFYLKSVKTLYPDLCITDDNGILNYVPTNGIPLFTADELKKYGK